MKSAENKFKREYSQRGAILANIFGTLAGLGAAVGVDVLLHSINVLQNHSATEMISEWEVIPIAIISYLSGFAVNLWYENSVNNETRS